jgi:hypothetical protein
MHSPRILLLALAASLATACGSSDPVGYSAPVGISLDAKSSDVAAGQIHVDKSVSTETGNPYGAFVNAAVKALGRAPSRIVVTSATLTLDPAGSSQVAALEQVFTGMVRVSFQPNGSATAYPAAAVTSPVGVGPVPMTVNFDSSSMSPADFGDLVGGAFKVVLDGSAATGFAGKGATADMTATFTFEAFP